MGKMYKANKSGKIGKVLYEDDIGTLLMWTSDLIESRTYWDAIDVKRYLTEYTPPVVEKHIKSVYKNKKTGRVSVYGMEIDTHEFWDYCGTIEVTITQRDGENKLTSVEMVNG